MRYSIEFLCRVDDIPNEIDIDLPHSDRGWHISMVVLPDGVEPTITDRDFTIATVAAPTVVVEETVARARKAKRAASPKMRPARL